MIDNQRAATAMYKIVVTVTTAAKLKTKEQRRRCDGIAVVAVVLFSPPLRLRTTGKRFLVECVGVLSIDSRRSLLSRL